MCARWKKSVHVCSEMTSVISSDSKPSSLLLKRINHINYILSGQLWLFYTSYYRFSIPCHLLLAELNLLVIDLISFGTLSARPSRIIMMWMVGGTMEPMFRIEPQSPCGDGDGRMKALLSKLTYCCTDVISLSLYIYISSHLSVFSLIPSGWQHREPLAMSRVITV